MTKLTKKKETTPEFIVSKNKVKRPAPTIPKRKIPRRNNVKRLGYYDYDFGMSKERFTELVYKCSGLIKYIAAACHVTRATVYRWVQKYPWIKEVIKDCDEDTIDLAIHSVTKNIRKGKEYTTSWYLDRKGKKRGLNPPKQIIQHDHNDYENMDDDAIDKAMLEEEERIILCQQQQPLPPKKKKKKKKQK